MSSKGIELEVRLDRREPIGRPIQVRAPTDVNLIAFFGDNCDIDEGAHAQILCWPTTATAWHALTQSWRTLRTPGVKSPPAVNASWSYRYGPQLCGVYVDAAALETSIAALITRAAMGMSVAVSDSNRRSSRREMFQDCLVGYQEFLRTPGRYMWSVAIATAPRGAHTVEEDFRQASQGVSIPKPPLLQVWDGDVDPIPLEIARIAAGAVARHMESPGTPNPIFEAVRTKLATMPAQLTARPRSRRR